MTDFGNTAGKHISGWIKLGLFVCCLLSLSVGAQAATTVTLTTPAANAQFGAPANITLSAAAIPDAGQTITNVKFYRGTTLIGTDTTAPYSVTWSNAVAGTYSLTAKATNNLNQVVTSVATSITVTASPTIALSAPAAIAGFNTGSNITITATATPSSGQIITQVEFFATTTTAGVPSTQSIGMATSSPYSITWNNVAAGTYSLTAKASDNLGGTKTSAARTINVANPPTVSLTSPVANTQFGAPASITLTADALTDTSGSPAQTITDVKFYRDTTLIGTDTTAPYSVIWSNAAAGSYSLTAKVTTSLNLTTTSSANSITIKASPTVALSAPANNASFTANPTITVNATTTPSSGQSITQVQFYASLGTATPVLIGTDTTSPYSISWPNVRGGSYSLTAKATDNLGGTRTSAARSITVAAAPNVPPTVSITAPANNATFTAPATVSITANAADSDGSITQVQFYGGDLNSNPSATLLTTDTTAPYSFDLINVAAGSYTITAKATDNSTSNNSTISSPIQFTVNTPASTGQVYFIHTDQLNTPRLITNSTNVKVWQWDNNDPFGNNVPNDDPNNSNTHFSFNLRLLGQYADSETGLNYNYFRDYSPQEGRYIESDPIGLEGGQFSTYAYVDSNPLLYTDEYGLGSKPKGFMDDGNGNVLTGGTRGGGSSSSSSGNISTGGSRSGGAEATAKACKVAEKASEKMARDIAKRIERDLGKDARREFHDMDHLVDRTAAQLRADAKELYDAAGKAVPGWLK